MRACMTTATPHIVIALSRRNLVELLAALDGDGSPRTLITRNVLVDDEPSAKALLVLVAEEDEDHDVAQKATSPAPSDERVLARPASATAGGIGSARPRHEPGCLHPWVFGQHQVWVDRDGVEHEIESMPRDYVENVVGFCERNVWRMWWAVASAELLAKLAYITSLANADAQQAALELRDLLARYEREAAADAREWLQATPLYAALQRRAGSAKG
jgi:hypothetical protein